MQKERRFKGEGTPHKENFVRKEIPIQLPKPSDARFYREMNDVSRLISVMALERRCVQEPMAIRRETTTFASISNLRQLTQVVCCGGGQAKVLQIGWNLLEQHVGADLCLAAARPGCT